MKARTLAIISGLLNIGMLLAAGFVFGARRSPEQTVATPTPPAQTSPDTSGEAAPVTAPAAANLTWGEMESPDYKLYIARLRGIGCPEATIRDMIVAEVNKRYAQKRGVIRRGGENFVYWRADQPFESRQDYYPRLREERAAVREKHALLKELLGVDPSEEIRRQAGTYDYLEWQYDFLPGDKRDQAGQIQENYLDLQRELYPTNRSSPAVRQALRDLFQKRLDELATFLTPQELEEYNLRSSHAAEALRNLLDGFDPTAAEFKHIFEIRQKRAADLTLLDPSDGDAVARYQQASTATDGEIRVLLGEERYARYQRAQDSAYKLLNRLAEARDLPSDTAERAYQIKATMDEATRQLGADPGLTPEQRDAAIVKVRNESADALIKLVGQKNLDMYRNRGGRWVPQ